MSYSVTLLLGYFVLFLSLQTSLPSTSENIPTLTIFLLTVMALGLVQTCCSAVIIAIGDTEDGVSKNSTRRRRKYANVLNKTAFWLSIAATVALVVLFGLFQLQKSALAKNYEPISRQRFCPWLSANESKTRDDESQPTDYILHMNELGKLSSQDENSTFRSYSDLMEAATALAKAAANGNPPVAYEDPEAVWEK